MEHHGGLSFALFPDEIVVMVLESLPDDDVIVACFVSRLWYACLRPRLVGPLKYRKSVYCARLAFLGHLNLLLWAREKRCPWDKWTCAAAASGGHLEVLQCARKLRAPWDWWTCLAAAAGGHLEVLLLWWLVRGK